MDDKRKKTILLEGFVEDIYGRPYVSVFFVDGTATFSNGYFYGKWKIEGEKFFLNIDHNDEDDDQWYEWKHSSEPRLRQALLEAYLSLITEEELLK